MERTRVKELAERRDETAEAARHKPAPRRARKPVRPEAETTLAGFHAGVGNGAIASSRDPAPLARANTDDVLALHSVYGNREVTRAAHTAETFDPRSRPDFAGSPLAPAPADTPTTAEGLREAAKTAQAEAERTEESGEPEHRRAVEVKGGAASGAAEVKEEKATAEEAAGSKVAAKTGSPVEPGAGAPGAAEQPAAQQAQKKELAEKKPESEKLAEEKVAAGEKEGKGAKEKGDKGDEKGEGGKAAGEGEDGGGGGAAGAAGGADVGGAVSAMSDAVAGLGAPMAEASALATGRVSFAPREEERSTEPTVAYEGLQKRAASEAAANSFLSRNASHALNLVALGLSAPPRLLAVAGMAKSAVDAAAAENTAATKARIAAVRAQANSKAAAAVKRISAERDAALKSITEVTTTTKDAVQKAFDTVSTTLNTLESEQKTGIDNLYRVWEPKFRKVGTEVGDEAVAAAEVCARDWLAQRNGESSWLDGPIHDNRLEARADAARNVAKEYKTSLEKSAGEQTDTLAKGKPEVLKAVAGTATEARDTLKAQLKEIQDSLDASEKRALAQAEQTATNLIKSVQASLKTTLGTLGEQEAAQVARFAEYAERQKGAIDRDAAQAVASLLTGAGEAAAGFNEALRGLSETVLNTEAPEEAALSPLLAEVQGQTDALAASTFQKFEEGVRASEQGLADGGARSVEALNKLGQSAIEQAGAVGTGYSQSVAGLVEQASRGIKQLVKGHTKAAADSKAAAVKGFTEVGEGLKKTFSALGTNVKTSFEKSEKELREGLRGSLGKLQNDITTYAQKAADEVQPRWKKVLKVLLVIVVVVIVAVVTMGAGLGVLGTIALGVALGAASGAVIQIGNNLIDGKKWSDGVVKAMVVGAIGGLFGGLGGALAKGVVNVGLKIGVEVGVDVIGGIVGDLVVGNPITLQGVLIGAGIGAGIGGGLAGLSALKGKIKIKPTVDTPTPVVKPAVDVPTVKTGVDAPTPAAKPAPELPGGVAGKSPDGTVAGAKTEVPTTAATKPDIPPTKPKAAEPTTKPAATDKPAAKPAEGAGAKPEPPHGMEHGDLSQQRNVGGGHEVKVLKNGDIVRCSDNCELITQRYKSIIDADQEVSKRLDDIKSRLDSPDPKVKEKAGKDLEAFEGDMEKKLKEGIKPPETTTKQPETKTPEAEVKPPEEPKLKLDPDAEVGKASGKRWDDPTMTEKEFLADYAKEYANSPLVKEKGQKTLKKYFKEGKRLNPETGALKTPLAPIKPTGKSTLPPPGTPEHTTWKNYELGKPPICFPAGTLIHTPSGARAIETLAGRDLVFSFDFDSGRVVTERIAAVHKNWTQYITVVRTTRGTVSSTRGHPFWVESESRWVPAGGLQAGMVLRLLDGTTARVVAAETFAAEEDSYNFEVEGRRNYFAGPDGVLVHNGVEDSSFMLTETYDYKIYEITDIRTGEVIYVGQSVNEVDARFSQHLDDVDSAIHQYINDPKSPGYIPKNDPLRKPPNFPGNVKGKILKTEQVAKGNWTSYEAAVHEQHHIERHGGVKGGKLINKIRAITKEKFVLYRDLHNPCR